jgi:RsiW-degrading membrane proteinase PrsW (M82 family)
LQRISRLFFLASMFIGPLLMVGLAVLVTNAFFPKPEQKEAQELYQLAKQLDRKDWMHTATRRLLKVYPDSLALHLEYIYSFSDEDSINKAINTYKQLSSLPDRFQRSKASLCLGLLHNQKKDYLRAKLSFNRVRFRNLPFLHLGMGVSEIGLKRYDAAEIALLKELQVRGGDSTRALCALGEMYARQGQDSSLWGLRDRFGQLACFPASPLRGVAFKKKAWSDYFSIIFVNIQNRFTWSGFLAALLVTFVWLAYLIQLHVFSKGSRRYLGFSFGLGMLMSLATYILSDFQHFALGLDASRGWLSELVYHIAAIGIIEEFAKILPLLLIFRLPGVVKEPYDLILHASTAALGFAFIENGLYYDGQNLHIIHARAMTAVVGHMFQASLIAYAIVWRRVRAKHIPAWLAFGVALVLAGIWHGCANFFLHQGMRFAYLLQLTVGLYFWTLFINNALNASPWFDSRMRISQRQIMTYLMVGLTSVLVLEYILAGWHFGPSEANEMIKKAAVSGSFLIILLAFMLSRFKLKENFWRKI